VRRQARASGGGRVVSKGPAAPVRFRERTLCAGVAPGPKQRGRRVRSVAGRVWLAVCGGEKVAWQTHAMVAAVVD